MWRAESVKAARDYGVPPGAAGTTGFFEVPGDLPVSTFRMLIGVVGPVAVFSAVTVAAPCVRVTVMPAILIVAERATVPVLAETV